MYSSAPGRWVIAGAVMGSGVAAIDATVVGIALPTIGRSMHADLGTLQWVVTAYMVTLAAFLLLGGALGDRFGRARVFAIGVGWFSLASAACGLAPNAGLLVAARALQGVGAALLAPASLAILQASFRAKDRPRAIGAWSGLGGLATAAGPLVGGYLISVGSWRWVFFINLPVGALVMWIVRTHVPESRDPDASGPLDLSGAALAVGWLTATTYALIEGSTRGWSSPLVVGGLALGVVGFVVFLVVERVVPNPMLPLGLFRTRQFSAANAVTFAIYAALGGALFLLPVERQVVSGYTPLQAGLTLLPVTVIMLLFSARSGRLAARIGPRLQMSVGPLVVAAGLAMLSRMAPSGSYLVVVFPAMVVFGAGLAITVAPAHVDGDGRRPSPARGHGVGGEQRRRPHGGTAGGGRAALPGRHHGRRLPASGGAGVGLPHRTAHRRGRVRVGWSAGRLHHPQPGSVDTRGRIRVPALRARLPAGRGPVRLCNGGVVA